MPQLIAMVIVVVGAMIYMFQTFGGTGDTIEGVAQKSSIITEIRNINDGIKLAVNASILRATDSTAVGAVSTLEGIAEELFFTNQINFAINTDDTTVLDTVNTYQAISFGSDNSLEISLVLPAKANVANARPGVFVDLSQGSLAGNAAFLESQVTGDLAALYTIDRSATDTTAVELDVRGEFVTAPTETTTNLADGQFTIYFKEYVGNIRP